MREAAFQGWVVDVAKQLGWVVWHVPTPMRPIAGGKFVPDKRGRGLPDLIMLHEDPPRLIFAELKGHGGVLSVEQKEFLRLARAIASVACEAYSDELMMGAYSWHPGSEEMIQAILRGKKMA